MKYNNKGFTLVELIIVIGIIAILSAALAPSFLKYINRAAIVSDKQTCKSLEKMIYTILTDDENHDLFAVNGGMRGGKVSFMFVPDRDVGDYKFIAVFTKSVALYGDRLYYAINDNTPKIHAPKETGKCSYYVAINVYETTIRDEYSGTTKKIYTIGDIHVETENVYTNDELREFFRQKGATNFYF